MLLALLTTVHMESERSAHSQVLQTNLLTSSAEKEAAEKEWHVRRARLPLNLPRPLLGRLHVADNLTRGWRLWLWTQRDSTIVTLFGGACGSPDTSRTISSATPGHACASGVLRPGVYTLTNPPSDTGRFHVSKVYRFGA